MNTMQSTLLISQHASFNRSWWGCCCLLLYVDKFCPPEYNYYIVCLSTTDASSRTSARPRCVEKDVIFPSHQLPQPNTQTNANQISVPPLKPQYPPPPILSRGYRSPTTSPLGSYYRHLKANFISLGLARSEGLNTDSSASCGGGWKEHPPIWWGEGHTRGCGLRSFISEGGRYQGVRERLLPVWQVLRSARKNCYCHCDLYCQLHDDNSPAASNKFLVNDFTAGKRKLEELA